MAITLGTFQELKDGSYSGSIKTLTVNAKLNIVPIDATSERAPDYRVYTGSNCEIGAGWSRVSKTSGETYLNLQIAALEFGQSYIYLNLVKSEQASDVGATHILLWEPKREQKV